MKKKLFSIVLCLVMVVSMLTGCKSTKDNTNNNTNDVKDDTASVTPDVAKEDGDKGLIVYSQKTLDHYFHVALQESVKRAAESRGYKFEVAVCDFDSALQTQQVQTFIAKNPVAMIINPVDSDSLIDSTADAVAAGIPIGVVDNKITGGKIDITVTFNNELAGEMAAQEIIDRLIVKYGEAKGKVVNVYGAMSSEAWRLRKEGFEKVMANYPSVDYIAVPGEGDQGITQEALTNVIATQGTIDAVHCPSDSPGLGLIEALKIADMWKTTKEEGHVIFVTIDGEPVAVKNVEDGYFDASIVQDALAYGPVALDIIEQYVLTGKDVPIDGEYVNEDYYWQKATFQQSDVGAALIIPPYVMDSSNIDDNRHWGKIAVNEWGLTYK